MIHAAAIYLSVIVASSHLIQQTLNSINSYYYGVAIGNGLSGIIARVVTLEWDLQLIDLVKTTPIILPEEHPKIELLKLSKRYVDDHFGDHDPLPPGFIWDPDSRTIRFDQETLDQDPERPADKRTMLAIQGMANTINPSIQLTIDYPSAHPDGRMPVLDFVCWVDPTTKKIMYSFYRKPMCRVNTILASSALSWTTKRTVLTQEAVRILTRSSLELPWEEKAKNMTVFMARMANSGYSHKFRLQVLKNSLRAFEKILEREARGERPLHRADIHDKPQRKKDKIWRKHTWFRRGGYVTTLYVPPTPGSVLAKKMQESVVRDSSGDKIQVRVVERKGPTILSILQKSDPTPKRPCSKEDCFPCTSGNIGKCRLPSVLYRLRCETCCDTIQQDPAHPPGTAPGPGPDQGQGHQNPRVPPPTYVGETGRVMYIRGKEHLSALQRKDPHSALWKHSAHIHGGTADSKSFSMKILTRHRDPLSRLIAEGVRINHLDPSSILNSKSEFRQPKVSRVSLARSLPEHTQQLGGGTQQQPPPPDQTTSLQASTPPPPSFNSEQVPT